MEEGGVTFLQEHVDERVVEEAEVPGVLARVLHHRLGEGPGGGEEVEEKEEEEKVNVGRGG